ncbi:hypothetical protein [Micromonospora sp. WMMD998]|uniref:hypothetical protein n=1 Tax=Micromonospora sp. WMMD998 TaxID=3016092 RepID=UPI00249B9191|nr:hypothetical protein [Micromonospora sp. WMMD998]WFE38042.1 hypothetical protein O7619_06190 [Micromonospora sp. WMMD998]
MTETTPGLRTIEVADDVYDVLKRTADSRDTDINGALRYLIEVPTPRAVADDED